MTERTTLSAGRIAWGAIAGAIIAASVVGAMALTLPYPTTSTPLVIAAYREQTQPNEHGVMRVSLAFDGIDARSVRIVFAGNEALGNVLLLSNGLVDCSPSVGTLQALSPQTLGPSASPHAVDSNDVSIGNVRAFAANIETAVSRQDCTLAHRARRYDFSTYGIDLLGGYRFLEDRGGTQFAPRDLHFSPVQDYLVRLDDTIEEVRFDGGKAVAARPNARDLTADASALVARWKDPHVANLREFALFILAGGFALGISMLIELVKPRFLE